MADVFISYKREDLEIARAVAHALSVQGFSVWWDTSLVAGQSFTPEILKQLVNAKAVVLCWTKNAATSKWVEAEARIAASANMLVPLTFDDTALHDDWKHVNVADMRTWPLTDFSSEVDGLILGVLHVIQNKDRAVPDVSSIVNPDTGAPVIVPISANFEEPEFPKNLLLPSKRARRLLRISFGASIALAFVLQVMRYINSNEWDLFGDHTRAVFGGLMIACLAVCHASALMIPKKNDTNLVGLTFGFGAFHLILFAALGISIGSIFNWLGFGGVLRSIIGNLLVIGILVAGPLLTIRLRRWMLLRERQEKLQAGS